MFDQLDDPKRQALLMMAAGLLSPQDGRMGKGSQFAAALSQGLQGGLLGFNNASREKRRAEALGQETEIRRMQTEAMKRQADEAQRMQAFRSAAFKPGVGAMPATPNDDNGFPMPSPNATFDPQAGAQVAPDLAYEWQQKMTPKANLQFAPDGTVVNLNDQTIAGKQFAKQEKPKFAKGDTRTIKMGNFEETQEYDGSAWKRIGQAPLWKPDAPDKAPAPPQGYQWGTDGKSLQAIPGGPADTKAGEKAEALKKREQGALARADFVLSKVGESIAKVGPLSTGAIGQLTRNFGNSPAFNLNKTIDPIKANIGFAELQAMREASPTGGALGQVAVQELNMLQSVLGSLDTAQGQDELLKSLNGIHKHFTNWKRAVQQANQEQSGGGIDALVKKYGGQ